MSITSERMDAGLVGTHSTAFTLHHLAVLLIDTIGLYCNINPEKIPSPITGFSVVAGSKPQSNYAATSEPNTAWGLIRINFAACDVNLAD